MSAVASERDADGHDIPHMAGDYCGCECDRCQVAEWTCTCPDCGCREAGYE